MKNVTFILLLFLTPLSAIMAQSACQDTVKLSLATEYSGPDLIVNISAENFNDIIGFQFGMKYDVQVFKFKGVESGLPDFSSVNVSNINSILRFLWLDNSTLGQSTTDGSTIITLKFEVLQQNSSSFIAISETLLPIEFINNQNEVLCKNR